MPSYIYKCENGHVTEKFESITAPTSQPCPECPKFLPKDWCESCKDTNDCNCHAGPCTCPDYTMRRQIGAGSGFTFKGGAPTRKFHTRRA